MGELKLNNRPNWPICLKSPHLYSPWSHFKLKFDQQYRRFAPCLPQRTPPIPFLHFDPTFACLTQPLSSEQAEQGERAVAAEVLAAGRSPAELLPQRRRQGADMHRYLTLKRVHCQLSSPSWIPKAKYEKIAVKP